MFIDRDGTHFAHILNYLRDGSTTLPDSESGKHALLKEARYYAMEDLAKQIERVLFRRPSQVRDCE